MPSHFEAMWASLDYIARLKKCSCSRLAINGGLDPTAFNKSKRRTKYGQEHWMSFGSLVNTLRGTDMTMIDFAVIYQILQMSQKSIETEQMKEIMSEIGTIMQKHIDSLNSAQYTRHVK